MHPAWWRARVAGGCSMLLHSVLAAAVLAASESAGAELLHCDVLIAGGSTAALSAALTSAVASPGTVTCLTEPTDELGGQLAFNPAIDYGKSPKSPSKEWASLVVAVTDSNSACWVSKSCYPPARLAAWVHGRLAALPNLRVLLRTTVTGAAREHGTGRVTALRLVTRTPLSSATEWDGRLSETLTDWYSSEPSHTFTKQVRTVSAAVVVEASELGDVLATAGLPHTQGIEVPTESSMTTDDGISQSICFTFYMELLAEAPPASDPAPRGDSWVSSGAKPFWGAAPEVSCCCGGQNARPANAKTCKGQPINGSCLWPGQCSWAGVWAYRRSTRGAGPAAMPGVNVGDVAMINWGHGNDMAAANAFLPAVDARATAANGSWAGGVNSTSLRMAEDRAYGWFHEMSSTAGSSLNPGAAAMPPSARLIINRNYSGTGNGLTKFFYVRDTRRSVGLGGFRLTHEMMMSGPGHPGTGVAFEDTVGLGDYNFDVKPGAGMGAANGGPRRLPGYMWNFTSNKGLSGHAAPFSFPLRALTVDGAPNVLTAGKTIAMTFAANTAAREHLDEWSCGVGAGAAAAMMASRNLTSAELLANVSALQAVLRSSTIQQPLSWKSAPSPSPSPPPPSPTRPRSFTCGAGRCFQSSSPGKYSNSSCIAAGTHTPSCAPLAAEDWLLLKAHWRLAPNRTQATALFDTRLKKATLPASSLPAGEVKDVAEGTTLLFSKPAVSADGEYDLAILSHAVTPSPSPPPSPPPPPAPAEEVTTHSPVFRWTPVVDRSEAFSVVLTLHEAKAEKLVWQSPPTWHLESTGSPVEEVGGVSIYQGPPLQPATEYRWSVVEKSKNGTVGAQVGGSVRTSASLPSPQEEARKAVQMGNMSLLYQGTVRSILCRIHNGSMPTSVNGGYSGMFTRDSSVLLLGLMEVAAARRDDGDEAAAIHILGKVEEVLSFMMRQLVNSTFMPHIIDNPPGGANAISGNLIDESDQTAYVMMAFGTYTTLNNASEFESEHYPLMKRLLNSHVAPGAVSGPPDMYGHSTNSKITRGCCAGVPYYNETLGLIVNLNSEASREGHYWNGYTAITNSAMVEAMRLLSLSATRCGDHIQAVAWRARRADVLDGIQRSLTAKVDPAIAKQTGSETMYAELRARTQSFSPCSIPTVRTNPDELLTGLSWYNLAPISSYAASVGYALNATDEETGMRAAQMDSTMLQYRAEGFFVWQPRGREGSAFPVALNYVNASLHQYDVPPPHETTGRVDVGARKPGTGQARLVITMGWAWEAAWAAHRQDWPRVALMHRWLAALPVGYPHATDVAGYPTVAEGYDYDCFRNTPDASDSCFHDTGNGIMAGWFVWAETITRRALGVSTSIHVDCPAG
jgi:hypothetical protein